MTLLANKNGRKYCTAKSCEDSRTMILLTDINELYQAAIYMHRESRSMNTPRR